MKDFSGSLAVTYTDDMSSWMRANRLQLNPSETEVMWCWCSSQRRQHQIPNRPVHIGSTAILPVSSVRDLGVHVDTDLTVRSHVIATVQSCFAALRQIRCRAAFLNASHS